MYFISPVENKVGKANSNRKKPLKRSREIQKIAKHCKNEALKNAIVKVNDIKTFYLSEKRGKKALPISPLLTEREKRRVRRGKSWLISWEEFCSDDESDVSISSSSSDNELDEFLSE